MQTLRQQREFQSLVLAAQSDDRASFDKLKNIDKEKNNRFSDLARQAWFMIFEAHSVSMFQSGFKLPWSAGVDPSKFSLPELSNLYKSSSAPLKPALLEYIWLRNDIQKLNRLDFMMDIMKTDSSLTAVEYAGRFFTQGTGQGIKPMALEYLIPWWSDHRPEFVDK